MYLIVNGYGAEALGPPDFGAEVFLVGGGSSLVVMDDALGRLRTSVDAAAVVFRLELPQDPTPGQHVAAAAASSPATAAGGGLTSSQTSCKAEKTSGVIAQ